MPLFSQVFLIVFLLTLLMLRFKDFFPFSLKRPSLEGFSENTLLKQNLINRFHEDLMANPDKDVQVKYWESEMESREKIEIHRARLKKYGKSRINGVLLYLGPRGGVYKITSSGRKIYI